MHAPHRYPDGTGLRRFHSSCSHCSSWLIGAAGRSSAIGLDNAGDRCCAGGRCWSGWKGSPQSGRHTRSRQIGCFCDSDSLVSFLVPIRCCLSNPALRAMWSRCRGWNGFGWFTAIEARGIATRSFAAFASSLTASTPWSAAGGVWRPGVGSWDGHWRLSAMCFRWS